MVFYTVLYFLLSLVRFLLHYLPSSFTHLYRREGLVSTDRQEPQQASVCSSEISPVCLSGMEQC